MCEKFFSLFFSLASLPASVNIEALREKKKKGGIAIAAQHRSLVLCVLKKEKRKKKVLTTFLNTNFIKLKQKCLLKKKPKRMKKRHEGKTLNIHVNWLMRNEESHGFPLFVKRFALL